MNDQTTNADHTGHADHTGADSAATALVISDIDGTLITSNHEVTEGTRRAASQLLERGIHLTLASSRPPRSIRPLAEALGLDAPFAAFNGGLIITADGKTMAASTLPPAVTVRIKEIANNLDLDVWLYDEIDWWASQHTAFVEREEHTSGFCAVFEGYAEQLARPLHKLTVVGKPDNVAVAEVRILGELGSEVSASRSKPRFLDVTSYGWHKGAVVGRMAEVFGTMPDRVAVIGDGPNDVVMFEQAGLSIAMGQAVDAVRERADVITTSNDDEGWAKGITKYVLQRRR